MLEPTHLGGLFLAKVIFGILAIGFNAICVLAVFKRYKYAQKNDKGGMDSVEPLMKFGGLVIPTFLIAFGLSMYFVINV